jgi:hypothetical protein
MNHLNHLNHSYPYSISADASMLLAQTLDPTAATASEAAGPAAPTIQDAVVVNAPQLPNTEVCQGDALKAQAHRGDAMGDYAARFARDVNNDGRLDGAEIRAYLEDLRGANGGTLSLRAGKSVKLPVTANSSQQLSYAVAVQATMGFQYPELDWLSATPAGEGPMGTHAVSFRDPLGRSYKFLVAPGRADSRKAEYSVMDRSLARKYLPWYR